MFAYREASLAKGCLVLGIDTKKQELLGNFFPSGRAWTSGKPDNWVHDLPGSSWGRVIRQGVYDLGHIEALPDRPGGTDTGRLAVDAVRRWCFRFGHWNYKPNTPILLLADCGASNGHCVTLFREQL